MRLAEVRREKPCCAAMVSPCRGACCCPPARIRRRGDRGWPGLFLKAQVLEGGRGKAGLVRRFERRGDFRDARRLILATLDDADTPLLLEEAVPIAREIFVAVRVDGTRQRLELLIAPQGGENVEQSAKNSARIPIEPRRRRRRRRSLRRSPSCFRATSRRGLRATRRGCRTSPGRRILELLEINPLALTADGRFIACDAKIDPRRGADFRHDPDEFRVEPHARRARPDHARALGTRPRLPARRDRRRRRAGHFRRRARHDDDGPAGRSRASRRKLHGQSARRARRDHDRAAENRPRTGGAAEISRRSCSRP